MISTFVKDSSSWKFIEMNGECIFLYITILIRLKWKGDGNAAFKRCKNQGKTVLIWHQMESPITCVSTGKFLLRVWIVLSVILLRSYFNHRNCSFESRVRGQPVYIYNWKKSRTGIIYTWNLPKLASPRQIWDNSDTTQCDDFVQQWRFFFEQLFFSKRFLGLRCFSRSLLNHCIGCTISCTSYFDNQSLEKYRYTCMHCVFYFIHNYYGCLRILCFLLVHD